MERFTQELFEVGVAKEAAVTPKSAVKGKKLPEIKTNLSIIDAKGAFVTAQKIEKKNANTTINFDEFLVCLALCGSIKYAEVKDADGKELMGLGDKVAGIFANYLGEADETQVIQKCFPPPPRFNPAVAAAPGKPPPVASFMTAWKAMDLSHLWGFPTFEEGVFAVLSDNFAELNSIFSQYAKSGTAGSSSMTSLMTIQQTEFTTFALDCGLMNDSFSTARINNIFTRADQVDDTLKATKVKTIGVDKNAKSKGTDVAQNKDSAADHIVAEVEVTVMAGDFAKAGDHGLTFPEFLEALCACALFRANPKLGEVGHNDECEDPLPGCLDALLKTNVLTNAKRDKLALVKSSMETDADVLAQLPEVKKRLQHTQNPEIRSFDAITKVGVRTVFGKQVMNMDMLQDELTLRRCTKEITLKPTPKIKGDVWPDRHSNLSWLDAKGAFTTCQNGYSGRDQAETDEGNTTIDFDEFIVCLGLMGHIKYEEIDEMSLADRFAAMVDNWTLERDEQAVIDDHCVPLPPRYDTSKAQVLKGWDDKEHQRLLKTWALMDLMHVYGCPAWEEEVFGIVQRNFLELVSIFSKYAMSGSAGSGSAKQVMTMQSTELTNLALDCELATDNFKTARINTIFDRADQVDSTLKGSRGDKRKMEGEAAKQGDAGLELHEFLECLVFLAFSRANPDFGNVGKNVDPDVEAPKAFEDLLTKNILVKAKRDGLAKTRKILDKDPEVQVVKRNRYKALKAQFEKVCERDATTMMGTKDQFGNAGGEDDGAGSTLGMDVFCDEMSDRTVSEDVGVTPTPNITGLFLPKVHSNLSWLDCKGAYATCQADAGKEMETIDFDEFLTCLALCGTIKYENVKGLGDAGRDNEHVVTGEDPTPAAGAEMPLPVLVDGIYANFLGEKDAHCVITEFQQPTLPRFDAAASGYDPKWVGVYGRMDLSHVYGFPCWEEGVFKVLGDNYTDLKLIFQQYAKTGSAGSSSAQQLFTMQKTELTNLSIDCGLSNENFSQTRVINIFERADQVDDTYKVSKANRHVKSGTSAEKGDHGLELHEFMECLVALAFARANPKHGQVGANDGAKNDFVMLPGCLENLLKTCILQKAKRDQVPGWMAEIATSADVQKVVEDYRDEMGMVWRAAAGKGQQGSQMNNKNMTDTGVTMTVDDFSNSMIHYPSDDRPLMADLYIAPRPPVVGQAVEKVHLNLSSIDIKGAFVGAQDVDVTAGDKGVFRQGENTKAADKLSMGNQNHQINFEEYLNAVALCGHIKYAEVQGSTMADRVRGAYDNLLGKRTEKEVISDVIYPPPPRTKVADTAGPLGGQADEQHQLFVSTWKEAMKACLVIDVIGFPVWEEAIFLLLQPIFDELQSIFSHYAQSIAGGSLQKTTLLTVTLQDNELISFCRDSGLINEQFSNARVQSLFKDVSNAFAATKSFGETAGAGQGGGSGVYSEGIHMPGFLVLLLMIALNRANPKLGRVGEAGEQAVDEPLPGCLEAMLQKNILKKAKRNKMSLLKGELLAADPKAIFGSYRGTLKREFEQACKKREKMPAVALFSKLVMSRPTLVADLKDRGVIIAKNVKGKPKVTGSAAPEMELALAAMDVESAFTLCQDGAHGEAANDTIEFDEFLVALGMCGLFKYGAVEAMGVQQKCEAIVAEYLGKASIEDVVASAAPKVERLDPDAMGAPKAFVDCWKKMDTLQYIQGFPVWEQDVFGLLAGAFDDLEPLFTYYAGDSPGMQQTELVDLALDNNMATKKYPITMIVALFEQVNKESGAGDADFELHEFLTFLIQLAFSRDGPEPASLEGLLAGLRRSAKVEELTPLLDSVKGEGGAASAVAAGEATLSAAFAKAGGGQPVSERALLQYLEACKLIRAVIVTLKGGADGRCDLTWQDASAAFRLSGGGSPLGQEAFSQCMALCGLVKYGGVPTLSDSAKVEGFLANLAGSKDEHAVIGAGETSF